MRNILTVSVGAMIARKYFYGRQCFNKLLLFNLNKCNYSTKQNVIYPKVSDINIPRSLIHEHIWSNIDKWPEKIALVSLQGQIFIYLCK